MRIRRTGREWALQFLFQSEFNTDGTLDEGLGRFWEEQDRERGEEEAKARKLGRPEAPEREKKQAAKERRKARRYAETLVRGVLEHHAEIDGWLAAHCENWSVDRMGVVDRNIMRIAAWEMAWGGDVPAAVAINEAVELAKEFSSRESGRFVNGVLDRVRKELEAKGAEGAAEGAAEGEEGRPAAPRPDGDGDGEGNERPEKDGEEG